jgi:prepilin-type N-terminal cleavage/methylation domain-containing protein
MRSTASKRRPAGNRDRRVTDRGFTLIETSIAMVILMIAALGVASLFTYAIGYNSGGNDRAVAISIAQQQLEQLRNVPYSDSLLNTTTASGTVLLPNTVSNGRSYRVTKTVIGANNDTNGNPTLKTITIQVNPLGSGWAGFPVILRTMRTR